MSKAIVDPGELRRFAHDLKRFNEAYATMTVAAYEVLEWAWDAGDVKHEEWKLETKYRFANQSLICLFTGFHDVGICDP